MIRAIYRRLKQKLWIAAVKAYVASSTSYQPLGSDKPAAGGRPNDAFETRWELIRTELEKCKAKNLLDIGCAQGWFVRNAAVQCNLFAIGLDQHKASLRLGSAYREFRNEDGYGFVPGFFSPGEIEQLPNFDAVVCLSLVHHVIKVSGPDGGLKFLKACRKITKRQFFFDIGGPEEVTHTWASEMQFLSGDLERNTREYLAEAGFTDIKKIGESLAHKDNVMRPLFACAP